MPRLPGPPALVGFGTGRHRRRSVWGRGGWAEVLQRLCCVTCHAGVGQLHIPHCPRSSSVSSGLLRLHPASPRVPPVPCWTPVTSAPRSALHGHPSEWVSALLQAGRREGKRREADGHGHGQGVNLGPDANGDWNQHFPAPLGHGLSSRLWEGLVLSDS